MAVAGMEPLFSSTLLVGVPSALFRGVVFLACVDSEQRLETDGAGSAAAALMVERHALLGFTGLLTLLGPVEVHTLRFKEEFSLPEETRSEIIIYYFNVMIFLMERNLPLAGDRDMLELKLDTDDDDEDVFFLLLGRGKAFTVGSFFTVP